MNKTQAYLNEVTLYGGIPLKRGDVFNIAKEDIGEGVFGADFYAYAGKAVDLEAWTIAEFRHMQKTGECP